MADQTVVEMQENVQAVVQVEAPGSDLDVSADKDSIITKTIKEIDTACKTAANSLMIQVGEIIIKHIFEDDTDQAEKDMKDSKSKSSKRELFDNMMKEFGRLRQVGDVPKKTWLYNAVNIAIQEQRFQDFTGYNNLSISHKIELLSVENEESQKQLVEQINSAKMSVRETRDAVKETKEQVEPKSKTPTVISVVKNPHLDVNVDELKYYGGKRRDKTTSLITEEIEKMKKAISTLEKIEQNLAKFGTKK